MAYRQIYAAYRDDENVADGTAEELARKLGVKPKTIRKWATQQIKRSGKFKANSYGLKLNHGRRTFLHCAEIRGVRIIWESGEF